MKSNQKIVLTRNALAVGFAFCVIALAVSGCSSADRDNTGSEFLLSEEPNGAVDVLKVRAEAEDQQDVVVVGRIGGRRDPWIKGTAAFPIVDRSLTPCSEMEGDTCPTPWDYCCETNLPEATALVRLVDQGGATVKEDPREFLNLKELQTVVVKGKATRDGNGNLTVFASQLYVRPDKQAKE